MIFRTPKSDSVVAGTRTDPRWPRCWWNLTCHQTVFQSLDCERRETNFPKHLRTLVSWTDPSGVLAQCSRYVFDNGVLGKRFLKNAQFPELLKKVAIT